MAPAAALPTTTELHAHLQGCLQSQRDRVARRLREQYDAVLARHGFLTDDAAALVHPLAQPIVAFPVWVAGAVGVADVLDVVEATVMGYLYVRVHDDLLDEGIGAEHEAMFLADAFLVRHQALLARRVTSERFWACFEQTAADYSEAMLLERELSAPNAPYGEDDFDRVLRRSQPLVLPGAALLDRADRWDLLGPLAAFVHHTVRAGQIVDDVLDCERDVAHGNHTWVVRRLGGIEAPEQMVANLVMGGADELAAMVCADLDRAAAAARSVGMVDALPWLADRRRHVLQLRDRLVASVFPE